MIFNEYKRRKQFRLTSLISALKQKEAEEQEVTSNTTMLEPLVMRIVNYQAGCNDWLMSTQNQYIQGVFQLIDIKMQGFSQQITQQNNAIEFIEKRLANTNHSGGYQGLIDHLRVSHPHRLDGRLFLPLPHNKDAHSRPQTFLHRS